VKKAETEDDELRPEYDLKSLRVRRLGSGRKNFGVIRESEERQMEVNYSKVVLKALAEVRRRQIVATKFNPQTENIYSDAFVHAVMHSVYPMNEEHLGFKDNLSEILDSLPFYETYDVSFELVKEIAEMLDKKWLNKEKITFYDVESPYRLSGEHWKGKDARMDLINICRYLYLSHMFDKDFWKEFMSESPSEASDVTSEWSRDELASDF
jgi:antitoxin MazE